MGGERESHRARGVLGAALMGRDCNGYSSHILPRKTSASLPMEPVGYTGEVK